MDSLQEIQSAIDSFYEQTKKLVGTTIVERENWNNTVTFESVKHYAYGIGDDSPRWVDANYVIAGGRRVAPPAYLTSVFYPMLHGANIQAPLSSLIGEIEYIWSSPVYVGDAITANATISDCYEKTGRKGRRMIFVISKVEYMNQKKEKIAESKGTMIRSTQVGSELMLQRSVYRYSQSELEQIEKQIMMKFRRGHEGRKFSEVKVGDDLGAVVKGPLTIGDMVAWNAGNGPGYRAAELAWKDVRKSPHTAVINPLTGHPVKYSLQHEDLHLSSQRGMPLPFANGVMVFAWCSTLITSWIGDSDLLSNLRVRLGEPYFYGDTAWVAGKVASRETVNGKNVVGIELAATNQLGGSMASGSAKVVLQ